MSKLYNIKLTPIDWYFFGGEKTFGDNGIHNYYAKSNLLPQETALLGMLRFELLKAEGMIPIKNKEKADQLVGSKSFNYQEKNSFGKIISISPVFILKDDELLFKTPKHYPFKNKNISFENGNVSFTCFSENSKIPFIEDFSGKEIPAESWTAVKNQVIHKEFDSENQKNGIFRTKTKIGITKMPAERIEDVDNKNGFFKTVLCTLNPGYSFFFQAELESEKLLGSRLVYLGAERSMFNMTVEDVKDLSEKWENIFESIEKKTDELIFISDAFVDSKVLSLCKFAWIDTVPFRNLTRTNKVDGNYASLGANEKSCRYNLIRRGSVLFFDEGKKEDIVNLIDNSNLQTVGYNRYLVRQ